MISVQIHLVRRSSTRRPADIETEVKASVASGLLGELLDESFAFASPRGNVTRWGAGAATLFGMPADEVAGRSLFDTVLAGGDDGGWRALLDGEADSAQRVVTTELRRADGREIPCVVRFLAVPLPDGLEFSSFSSDLSADRPPEETEELLRERHARVVELLEAEDGNTDPVELDGPQAGIVVTFRSTAPGLVTPDALLEDALERTERVEHEMVDMREPVSRLETQMGGLASQVEQAFKAMAELRSDIEKALAAGRDARQLAVDAQREADTTRRALAALRPVAGGVDPNGDEPAAPARPPRAGLRRLARADGDAHASGQLHGAEPRLQRTGRLLGGGVRERALAVQCGPGAPGRAQAAPQVSSPRASWRASTWSSRTCTAPGWSWS